MLQKKSNLREYYLPFLRFAPKSCWHMSFHARRKCSIKSKLILSIQDMANFEAEALVLARAFEELLYLFC